MREIWGIMRHPTDRTRKDFWTKIGRAFENRDGSLNLVFDYYPVNSEIRLQLRDRKEPEND